MKHCTFLFFVLGFMLEFPGISNAQFFAAGNFMEDAARSLQLQGKLDSTISFAVRPLATGAGSISIQSIYAGIDHQDEAKNWSAPFYFAKKKGKLGLLPVSIIQQYNSHHPYGWNDGAMIAAKGYQSLISAGFYASFGPLDIQLQPEYVFAANPAYEHNTSYGNKPSGSYAKLFTGQSAISLSAGAVSLGYGSQNLWWGPGIRSSLLMSNNAPGFEHFFFKTRKPLHTFIGSFEWQLVGGQLESDDRLAYENNHLLPNNFASKSRYLSGLVLSYQPKWVPGLFAGFTRAVQTYTAYNNSADLNFFEKYLPVLALAVQKKNNMFDDTLNRDQLASFFLRWLLPKANTEFYVEYGFNDYGYNARDYLMSPSHSAAYIAGFRKTIPLRKAERIDLNMEITQMSQTPDWMVRDAGNWYVHGQIVEGYTNQNQLLGAGAGFGANLQSMMATWVKGWKQLGLLIERVDRDPQTHTNKWIDLGVGILPQWKYRHLLFSGKFELISSKNYLWEANLNRLNFHSRVGITYLF
ncbi:MAG: hypothetical protein RLZZ28_1455 [Bacteroidota bacterium]